MRGRWSYRDYSPFLVMKGISPFPIIPLRTIGQWRDWPTQLLQQEDGGCYYYATINFPFERVTRNGMECWLWKCGLISILMTSTVQGGSCYLCIMVGEVGSGGEVTGGLQHPNNALLFCPKRLTHLGTSLTPHLLGISRDNPPDPTIRFAESCPL